MVCPKGIKVVEIDDEQYPLLAEAGKTLLRTILDTARDIEQKHGVPLRMMYNDLLLGTIGNMIEHSRNAFNESSLREAMNEE